MNPREIVQRLAEIAKDDTGVHISYIRDSQVCYTTSRRKEVVMIKACIMNILYKYHSQTTVQIGRIFRCHHSTVIHHLQAHPQRYDWEDDYHDLYNILCTESQKMSAYAFDTVGTLRLLRESFC